MPMQDLCCRGIGQLAYQPCTDMLVNMSLRMRFDMCLDMCVHKFVGVYG